MLKSNFPIIDLHCHLEGSIDPQKSYEILHRVGYPPAQNREEFFKQVTGVTSGRNNFFNAVSLLDNCLIDRSAIIDVVSDIVIRAAEQQVKILEMSFAPKGFKLQKPSPEGPRSYFDAVLAGIERGTRNRDIVVGLTVLVIVRHIAREFEEQRYGDLRNFIAEYRQAITGVDICTLDPLREQQDDWSRLQEICDFVKASGLHLSAHAGEFFDTEPVKQALRLGVERIGHGIRIIDNQEVLELVKAYNVTLEVCPISNYRTGALAPDTEHPLRRLLKAGVRVTINSDDQGVQNSTWRDDYEFAMKEIGLTEDEIKQCLRYSFEASFLPQEKKGKYMKLFADR